MVANRFAHVGVNLETHFCFELLGAVRAEQLAESFQKVRGFARGERSTFGLYTKWISQAHQFPQN